MLCIFRRYTPHEWSPTIVTAVYTVRLTDGENDDWVWHENPLILAQGPIRSEVRGPASTGACSTSIGPEGPLRCPINAPTLYTIQFLENRFYGDARSNRKVAPL